MEKKINIEDLSNELSELQNLISEINSDSSGEEILTAGKTAISEKIYKKIIQKVTSIKQKYQNTDIRITGFFISLSPILVNSFVTVNFEFKSD